VADRRVELEQLETRIVNARCRLLDIQAEMLRPPELPAAAADEPVGTVPAAYVDGLEQREALVQRRDPGVAPGPAETAGQRLHLAEQVERLLRTQQQWHADRTAALRDLETIGTRFEARELDLDRQTRDLHAARAAVQAEAETVTQLRLRLEAEQARAES